MSICIKADCKLLLYTDDSVLLCSNPNPKFVEEKLSEQLSTCVDWMTDNRLSLHLGKTESILFCSERNSKKSFEFGVTYNNQIIQRKESVKYLGIELASSVSFSSLVESVVKKSKCSSEISVQISKLYGCESKTHSLFCSNSVFI